MLLAGFEPEDESPIVFLRLRKAARKRGLAVYSLAPFASRGPGQDVRHAAAHRARRARQPRLTAAGRRRTAAGRAPSAAAAQALAADGAVILAGERLAEVPGALSALAALAAATGARLAWVPRRAGERGAIEAGALPGLLPHGRPVIGPAARGPRWRGPGASARCPRSRAGTAISILAAARPGTSDALVIAGVDPGDLPDPRRRRWTRWPPRRSWSAWKLRASAVTDRADVVLPVAAVAEKAGTFVNWEGRPGSFGVALEVPGV